MSKQHDLQLIAGIVTRLDAAKPANFSYTEAAYDEDLIEGVENFDLNADQNIPVSGLTEYDTFLLNKGARAQGASIPRMGWNHFIGRFSFNLRKLTQQFLKFLGIFTEALAHNAAEYDSGARYKTGDVCYTIMSLDGVKVYTWYIRVSLSPPTIQGIPPNIPFHWEEMQSATSGDALLPFSAPGYRHKYSIIDLTGNEYQTNTWYPVVTEFLEFVAEVNTGKPGVLQMLLEVYCNGAVAGFSDPHRAELALIATFTGFADSSKDIVLSQAFINMTTGADVDQYYSPIGYSKLVKGRQAVIWLRGGSIYALWNSFGSQFALYPEGYDNGVDEPVDPDIYRRFHITPGTLQTRVRTPRAARHDEAVNLEQVSGALPLPHAIGQGSQLDAIRIPGSYVAATADVANSCGQLPIADPGPFEMVVTGDAEGLYTTTQRLMVRATGDEYTRILAGNLVMVPWYLSTSPEGTTVSFSGLYRFKISPEGNLMLYYPAGDDPPDFWIDDATGCLMVDIE
jgi:hypothetical protein